MKIMLFSPFIVQSLKKLWRVAQRATRAEKVEVRHARAAGCRMRGAYTSSALRFVRTARLCEPVRVRERVRRFERRACRPHKAARAL
jgi:hypothetical protein